MVNNAVFSRPIKTAFRSLFQPLNERMNKCILWNVHCWVFYLYWIFVCIFLAFLWANETLGFLSVECVFRHRGGRGALLIQPYLLCFKLFCGICAVKRLKEESNIFFFHFRDVWTHTIHTICELSRSYNRSLLNCPGSAHLHSDQWVVDSLFLHQFVVCAELYDVPVLESSDDISIADSGQTVRHYDGRPAKSHLCQIHV